MSNALTIMAAAAVIATGAAAPAELKPNEVAVVANAASAESVSLAKFYAAQRGLKADHILLVRTSTEYDVSREDYDRQIRRPVRDLLTERKLARTVRCLALVWGMPVRVTGDKGAGADKQTDATVDSELALLWWDDYKLEKWIDNPLLWRKPAGNGAKRSPRGEKAPPLLLTARIDGPTREDAVRIIKASIATEKAGLDGTVYIDAGGRVPQYDAHFRTLHGFLRRHTKLQVVLDEKQAAFARGSCPNAALYVGWWSNRHYIPAFTWRQGAVGWHVAGFEAQKLRDATAGEWCGKMIQNGVAATLGAVNDPYLGHFPRPEELFPLLLTGKWTVAECYWRTVPAASWRMTLIADPLYNPFAAKPQVKVGDLPKGLAP